MSSNKKNKPNDGPSYIERIAGRLIDQLEQGVAPWQRPWLPGELRMPFNPTTDKPYRGFNSVWLMAQGYDDPRWLTYRQAASSGAQVRKGEKGAIIQFVKLTDQVPVTDTDGKPVIGDDGRQKLETVRYDRPRVFHAVVFNADQIDGLPPLELKTVTTEWDRQERCDNILQNSGVPIHHRQIDSAYYKPSDDSIHLPLREQFPTADGYYATALHELSHATGHRARLDRDMTHPFGSEGYAREELRAEIASLMLGEKLEIGHDPSHHASYVQSWIKVLKDDPKEIFRAANDADRISAWVADLERDRAVETELRPVCDDIVATIANRDRWHDPHARADANELGREALTLIEGGEYARALARLNAASELEAAHAGPGEPAFAGAAMGLETHWREWQKAQGFGPTITPAIQSAFRANDAGARKLNDTAPELDAVRNPTETAMKSTARIDLNVPFRDKDRAKAAGAQWDNDNKTWYAPAGVDIEPLRAWVRGAGKPIEPPETQFAKALKEHGLIVESPLMDGVFRRVPVEGDKDGQTGGAYVGYPDGHPAGYICNFRTGIEINWKAEGESKGLSDIDRVRLHEEARARQEKKVLDRAERHEQTSRRLEDELTRLPPAAADHPYLVRKGLAGDAGVLRQDQQGNLVIPAGDSDGRIWTVQRINGDGRKGFEKDGALAGHYNVTVTGQAAGGLGRKGPIVITEGWATGETIRRATGATVVTAFTAKNLAAVAKALREKHPDRPILIAGDNDHLKKRNVGLEAARDAANATNGHYLVPQFAPGSKGTDWNDYYLEFGEKALKQQIAEGIVLADRRRLATAQLTQEDGERVAEQIRQNQAKVEQLAPGAVLSVQRGQMEGLRQQARREAEVQDKSDENINSLDPEAVKKRAGRSRSRVA